MKTILTNRQLNFTLTPVDLYNKKEFPYFNGMYLTNNIWSHNHSIILDIINDYIFYKFYKKSPKSWRNREVMNKIKPLKYTHENIELLNTGPGINDEFSEYTYKENEKLISTFHLDTTFSFKFMDLFNRYDIMKKYRYTFVEILRHISQTKFRMNYRVKILEYPTTWTEDNKIVDRGVIGYRYYNMKKGEVLFELNVKNDIIALNFNTPLGKLVLQNTLFLDTDWMPIEVFNLNNNAFFIYKKFILNKIVSKNGINLEKIPLKFEEIIKSIDFKTNNTTYKKDVVENSFKNLIKHKFILRFEKRKNMRLKDQIYTLIIKENEVEKVKNNLIKFP